MKKRSNPITKPITSTKKPRTEDCPNSKWFEEYKDCFTFSFKPVNQIFIDRLSGDLIDWAKNDDNALRILDFPLKKGICEDTYYIWKNKHENLGIAHKVALSFIASRRELGALQRKYSETMVMKTQHNYDSIWELNKQRDKQEKIDIAIATMKAKEELLKSDRPQVIVLSELEYKKLEPQEKV